MTRNGKENTEKTPDDLEEWLKEKVPEFVVQNVEKMREYELCQTRAFEKTAQITGDPFWRAVADFFKWANGVSDAEL